MSAAHPLTTIFLSGFPNDLKEREFVNMFLGFRGFLGGVLKREESEEEGQRKQSIGFARFR